MSHMHVIGLDGTQLDSKCKLAELEGMYGLIIESWGQKNNTEYNKALKTIITRFQSMGIIKIDAFLASEPVLISMPDKEKRRLSNKEDGYFHIQNQQAETLRLELCRLQKFFSKSEKKKKASGNGSKRIFLHAKEIASPLKYKEIILGVINTSFETTKNNDEQTARPSKPYDKEIAKPTGTKKPKQFIIQSIIYERSQDVVDYIIYLSNGNCEACKHPAPFINMSGTPYLEVHHVIPLSKGGPDTPENCVALCPNCHRAMHYAENKEIITSKLYKNISRLNMNCNS